MKERPARLQIPNSERKALYNDWCQTQNATETAKKFGRAYTTIARIKKQDNWIERYEKIKENIWKAEDKREEQKIKSNLEYVTKLKIKLADEIMKRPESDARVRDLIAVMEYEDKLLGNLNPDQDIGLRGRSIIYAVIDAVTDDELDGFLGESKAILGRLSKAVDEKELPRIADC